MLDASFLPHAEGQDGPLQKELSTVLRKSGSALQEDKTSRTGTTSSDQPTDTQASTDASEFAQTFETIHQTGDVADTPQTDAFTNIASSASDSSTLSNLVLIEATEVEHTPIENIDRDIEDITAQIADIDIETLEISNPENINQDTSTQINTVEADLTDSNAIDGELAAYVTDTSGSITRIAQTAEVQNQIKVVAPHIQGFGQTGLANPHIIQTAEAIISAEAETEVQIHSETEISEAIDTLDADTDLNPRIQDPTGSLRSDTAIALNSQANVASPPTVSDTGSNLAPLTSVSPTLSSSPITVTPTPTQAIPPQTVQQIAAELSITKPNQDRIILQLDPPEMGRIAVDFKFDADRAVLATLSAELTDTGSQLRRHADQLIQALKDAGFEDVSLEFSQDGNVDSDTDAHEQAQTKTIFMSADTETDTYQPHTENLPSHSVYMTQSDAPLDLKL